MKNLLKIFIGFNVIWSTIFFLFQISMIIYTRNDGKWNKPLSISEYVKQGGEEFDYYAGYAYIASNHTVNYRKADRTSTSINSKSYLRYLYIMSYSFLWIYGFYSLHKIQTDKYPTEKDLKRAKDNGGIEKSSFRHYVFGIITTLISLYGVYYCIIYVTRFWLM